MTTGVRALKGAEKRGLISLTTLQKAGLDRSENVCVTCGVPFRGPTPTPRPFGCGCCAYHHGKTGPVNHPETCQHGQKGGNHMAKAKKKAAPKTPKKAANPKPVSPLRMVIRFTTVALLAFRKNKVEEGREALKKAIGELNGIGK